MTDQKFKRVNGSNDVTVDVRLICSSSKDLKKEIVIGIFREDLLHRINVFKINIDPLNQRLSDIPLLIKYFSKKISENYNIKQLEIDENNNFNDKINENSLSVPLKEAREKFEKEYLTIQLKKFNGNISKTASFVGMERSALHRKLKGLGIKEFN